MPIFYVTSVVYPHVFVYPVQKVGDVPVNTYVALLSAMLPPNTVPNEPPYSILQCHQRTATVSLTKIDKT